MAKKRKKYKSRRQRYERDKRNFKLVLIFGLIALVVLMFMNKEYLYDWYILNFTE